MPASADSPVPTRRLSPAPSVQTGTGFTQQHLGGLRRSIQKAGLSLGFSWGASESGSAQWLLSGAALQALSHLTPAVRKQWLSRRRESGRHWSQIFPGVRSGPARRTRGSPLGGGGWWQGCGPEVRRAGQTPRSSDHLPGEVLAGRAGDLNTGPWKPCRYLWAF